jgi:hypothetical protein
MEKGAGDTGEEEASEAIDKGWGGGGEAEGGWTADMEVDRGLYEKRGYVGRWVTPFRCPSRMFLEVFLSITRR